MCMQNEFQVESMRVSQLWSLATGRTAHIMQADITMQVLGPRWYDWLYWAS